ncbi:hypothetical protein GCM10023340_22600 [Nocardioides marinquilinus]|uniref:Ig-like domain repeat protein n=1 Tax=Nocardioides marinquilinus TaxID=1210400 RepID=A0ABP9PT29_9ACTN
MTALRRLLVLTVGAAASLALVPAGAAHADDASLVVTVQDVDRAFPAEATDPLDPAVTITAESDSVPPEDIDADVVDLPPGLALEQTGPAAWVVTGTPTQVGGTTARVDVSDGVAATQQVTFEAQVVADSATVTNTTPPTATAAPGEPITLTATVVDEDGTGTPSGQVVLTDGADELCRGTVDDGTASCTVDAAFPAQATSRTYQVVATLDSDQYAGSDGPDALTVTRPEPASLTVGGTAPGATVTVATTDPIDPEPTLTATSNTVPDAELTASAVGLPAGLSLVRPDPAAAAWVVRGTATGAPGSFPATLTVSDGPGGADDVEVTTTVVVTKDDATVTFTGGSPTTVAPGEAVTLTATVADPDGSGTPTGAVVFTSGGTELCTDESVVAGAASCTFPASFAAGTGTRTYQVVTTLESERYTGADGPDPLTLDLTPTLTVTGPTGPVAATASEPIADGVTVTADSNVRDDADLTATATGLPDGLSLVRPDTDEAAWTVTGRVTAAAGSYPVVVTVSDGAGGAADAVAAFTITVAKDAATLVYDGRRTFKAARTGDDVVEVTFAVVAADLDAHPLPVTGRVLVTDGVGGESLCGGAGDEDGVAISDGRVTCTFGADLVTASRTYDLVATLDSPQYTGEVTTEVVVSTDPVLEVATTATDPVTVVATDPVVDGPTITAGSNVVGGEAITATVAGLPAGLALTKTVDGDGNAVLTLTGTPDADAGTYAATVTVSDGPGNAADEVVTLTVVVERDDATLAYTGPTTQDVDRSGQAVTVSATVVDADGSAPVTGSVAFADGATTLCTAPVVDGAATCSFAATFTGRSRTYAVTATLAGPRFAGATAQPTGLVVGDVAAPARPTITAGPRAGSIVLADQLTFRYSAEAGARVQCRLTGAWAACPAGGVTYDRPAAGTHDFRVRAIDSAGNVSPVLARRVVVPVDDRAMTSSGPWQKRTTPSAYRGTYAAVVKRGASLTYRLDRATSVSLVVTKSPGYGGVDVFLGNRRLRTVNSTAAPTTRFRQLVKVADFSTPTSGTLRVVTHGASQVVVEGLAVTRATVG